MEEYERLGILWVKYWRRATYICLPVLIITGGLAIGLSITLSHWYLFLFVPSQIAFFVGMYYFKRIDAIKEKGAS